MARRRKGLPVHGWLNFDKPQGMTSTQAVTRVRRLYRGREGGPCRDARSARHRRAADRASARRPRPCRIVVEGAKEYRFTDPLRRRDRHRRCRGQGGGEQREAPDSRAEIEAKLGEFTGEIEQVPPRYSAVRVDGARAYDLARDEEDFELEPRRVSIARLALVAHPDQDRCVLEAHCGKGTYVRALARDLGRALGALGHVEVLRRTRVGGFDEACAVPLAKLEALAESGGHEALMTALEPVETALGDIPALALSGADADRLRRGQAVLLRGRDAPIVEGIVYATSRGKLVALGEMDKGELKPRRIFNLPR